MQDRHPIAFESRKLNETEQRYLVHEKEMTAVVHCLRVWRHYLLGAKFHVLTDNVAVSYFQNQPKLTPKQARWQGFLAEFDFTMGYKPGRANEVADALSRRLHLAAISAPESSLTAQVREGLTHDPTASTLLNCIQEGKTRRFWLEEGLIYTKGRRMFVPHHGNLRRAVMKDCHDSRWAGHPGIERTLALIEEKFYWPRMRDDVEMYVRTCLVCQQDKGEQLLPAGLLQPIPPPQRPWESLTMDFIVGMPTVDGKDSILVVVDRFSKYGTFIAAPKGCDGKLAASLFLGHVVKYWGLPRLIISDRDSRFTSKMWTELFKLLGTDLRFSTAGHPQTDGQTERVNALLETYLRHFVSATQRDWVRLLDTAQFSYNLLRNESTSKSPFEIVTGQQPLTPATLAASYKGPAPAAHKIAQEVQKDHDLVQACLLKAAHRAKKFADRKRRDVHYQVGDMVMVKIWRMKHKTKLHKGLKRKYEGPFRVLKKVGQVAYKLDIPQHMNTHPVFHVSQLKPYKADLEDPSRGESSRAPMGMMHQFEHEIDEVLAKRVVKQANRKPLVEYLIKWKGLPESETTWEQERHLWQFEPHIRAFNEGAETGASRD